MAIAGDIARPAILGRDDREVAGSGLDQGQSERFGQRGIGEYTAAGGCQTVEDRYIILLMLFRIGHLAIQVILVNGQQQVGEYFLRPAAHFTDIIPGTGNDHQVGDSLQLNGLAIYLQQGAQVLALVRSRHRQDDRFVRVIEKTRQFLPHRTEQLTAVWREKQIQFRAWGNDHHIFRLIVLVQAVLLVDFLVGTGDHQVRNTQYILLSLDAPGNIILTFDFVPLQTAGQ